MSITHTLTIITLGLLTVNGQQKIPTWNISVANNTNKSYGFPTIPATHYGFRANHMDFQQL